MEIKFTNMPTKRDSAIADAFQNFLCAALRAGCGMQLRQEPVILPASMVERRQDTGVSGKIWFDAEEPQGDSL